jgi:hypothetical protein
MELLLPHHLYQCHHGIHISRHSLIMVGKWTMNLTIRLNALTDSSGGPNRGRDNNKNKYKCVRHETTTIVLASAEVYVCMRKYLGCSTPFIDAYYRFAIFFSISSLSKNHIAWFLSTSQRFQARYVYVYVQVWIYLSLGVIGCRCCGCCWWVGRLCWRVFVIALIHILLFETSHTTYVVMMISVAS